MKKYLIIFGIFGIGFYLGTLAAYILKDDIDSEFLGQVGDFLGGFLNPLFALLSFIALLITIVFQSEELKNSREELKLTRKELAKSAEAQEKSFQILEQQRFENTFFSLLENINSNIKYFKENREFYVIYVEDRKYFKRTISFSYVARSICQILQFIDEYNTAQDNKTKYGNILKASFDRDILQLLAIYYFNNKEDTDTSKALELMNKYNTLEYMQYKISSDILDRIVKQYCKRSNIAFKKRVRCEYEKFMEQIVARYKNKGYGQIFSITSDATN